MCMLDSRFNSMYAIKRSFLLAHMTGSKLFLSCTVRKMDLNGILICPVRYEELRTSAVLKHAAGENRQTCTPNCYCGSVWPGASR